MTQIQRIETLMLHSITSSAIKLLNFNLVDLYQFHPLPSPSNPLYSVKFANFAKDYQGRLKELAGQMENSEKSRSKVAMIKMILMRHEKKDRFTRKLAATRLNTTKSEELRARYLNLNNKASGTRSAMKLLPCLLAM